MIPCRIIFLSIVIPCRIIFIRKGHPVALFLPLKDTLLSGTSRQVKYGSNPPPPGLVFARLNLKPAVLKNFVFDSEVCFLVCEVYRFWNTVGLELPMKHTQSYIALGALAGNPSDSIIGIRQYEEDFFRNSKLFK